MRQADRSKGVFKGSAALLGAGPIYSAASTRVASASVPHANLAGIIDNGRLSMNFALVLYRKAWILASGEVSFKEQFASKELARGLRNLGVACAPIHTAGSGAQTGTENAVFTLCLDNVSFKDPEAYEIRQAPSSKGGPRVRLTGGTDQAVLYAVSDFLEHQGAFFGLGGDIYLLHPARNLNLPPVNHPWQAQPYFETRGLLP